MDLLDFLLVSFIALALLFWSITIKYLEEERLSYEILLLGVFAGFVIAGELYEKFEAAVYINAMVEVMGVLIFSILISRHLIRAIRTPRREENRRTIQFYSLGFFIMVIGGSLTLISDFFAMVPVLFEALDIAWLIGFSTGFAIASITTAVAPHILIATYARAYRLLFVAPGGITVYSYDFGKEMESIDASLVGAAMTGIAALTKEIIGKEVNLRTIDHGEFFILVEFGKYVAGYLFVEKPAKILRESLSHALHRFEELFGKKAVNNIIVTEFVRFNEEVEKIFQYLL